MIPIEGNDEDVFARANRAFERMTPLERRLVLERFGRLVGGSLAHRWAEAVRRVLLDDVAPPVARRVRES